MSQSPATVAQGLALKRALRIPEFCETYGVTRSSAYRMMAAGTLKSVMIGGRRLIPVDVAEALIGAAN